VTLANFKHLPLNLAIAAILVLAPIKATLVVTLLLTLVDLITGVLAARKRGEAITSTGFKASVVKLLVYESVVVLSFLVERFLVGDLLPVVKIAGGMVGLTELKSVLENLEELTGMPLLKALIAKLGAGNDSETSK
jgi:phage-related holin